MSDEILKNLMDKFSCELVLASQEDVKSYSSLLPILKQMHTTCKTQGLKPEAGTIMETRRQVEAILKSDFQDINEPLQALETFVSDFSQRFHTLPDTDSPDAELTEIGLPDVESIQSDKDSFQTLENLETRLETLSMTLAGLCPGEIPDLGAILNQLDEIVLDSKPLHPSTFHTVSLACRDYAQNLPLEKIHHTRPIEEGLLLLKSILAHLKRNEAFVFDYSDVLELLDAHFTGDSQPVENETPGISNADLPGEPEKISDDDMEILVDFLSEAEENLDLIEVNLVDLEQDPSNTDIINDIFRPFHTIKGVSGFLSLTRINALAHATENLLDSARSGDFLINDIATDAILESVDTLKTLVARLREGVRTGYRLPDDDIDIDRLKQKLQTLQISLANGGSPPLGTILVKNAMIDQDALDQALERQKHQPDKRIGEILVENRQVECEQIDTALAEQNISRKNMDTQVKVSTQKLDDLVDYAGELVIAQSMLKQKTADNPSLSQTISHLGQIVTNMQKIAMSMRMIPIKSTFMKMIRLVRDLSRKSGKDVMLSMTGEDTEIDRNVVDALYEPMVHMIRNAVDHGIEPTAARREQGKPSQGSIRLRAYHKGGHIVIEIEDDGKGLDKKSILEKAKATGLITGSEQMTDPQIYDLILQPGFSTAKEITDVSGRGVGMDVVKQGIEKFRGQLTIDSTKGQGTRFTISLPLTLAIIDGMLVRVDNEKYVIPTTAIQKAFKPGDTDYFTVEGKGEMVKDRGSLIPVIRLNEIYGSSQTRNQVQDGLVVVVESKDGTRGLLIDELLGKDEYVIKSLGSDFTNVKGLAGGAILADGRVGLILDIDAVFSIAATA